MERYPLTPISDDDVPSWLTVERVYDDDEEATVAALVALIPLGAARLKKEASDVAARGQRPLPSTANSRDSREVHRGSAQPAPKQCREHREGVDDASAVLSGAAG